VSEKLVITGRNPLEGKVTISGAKNSVLKLMAAALLTTEPVHIKNVPNIADVHIMLEVLRHLGATAEFNEADGSLRIQAETIRTHEAPLQYVTKMRASFNVLAPLLARCGETKVGLPGGCSIGKRGVDLHIKGLQALGADVDIIHGCVVASSKQLIGHDVVFDLPSVGATENVMVAAVLAEGRTTLSNPAQEPEIIDLANFLNQMGADIQGAGTNEIIIQGVKQNQLKGLTYEVVPDRIEAATYLIAGAATKGDVTVENVRANHLQAALSKLSEMGATITHPTPTSIRITTNGTRNDRIFIIPAVPKFLRARDHVKFFKSVFAHLFFNFF
jgi:UDP-N-acetylglucosamine 1-carboxyvinyltransferase